MSEQFSPNRFVHRVSLANAIKQGWGLGKGRCLSPFTNLLCSALRPVPGSRVYLIPANTQGAGVSVSGAPVKGKIQNHDICSSCKIFL